MNLIVQKEIAERICDSKKESILSLSVKIFGQPELIAIIERKNFTPAPAVDAAFLSIRNIKNVCRENPEFVTLYFRVIKEAFAHKRKQLLGNIEDIKIKNSIREFLEKNKIPITVRAEDIPYDTWKNLIQYLQNEK